MTTFTRQAVIDTARGYLGTPWVHQARKRGVGVDCIGLLVCICRDLGLDVQDQADYPRVPRDDLLLREVASQMHASDAPADQDPPPGAILLFQFHPKRAPQHLAVMVEHGRMVHALGDVGKVCEHVYEDRWRKRLHSVYTIPGMQD